MKQKVKAFLKRFPLLKQISSRWNFLVSKFDELNVRSARLEEHVNQLRLQMEQQNVYLTETKKISDSKIENPDLIKHKINATHFSAYVIGNFGDNLLVKAVRKTFESLINNQTINWNEKDLRETLTFDTVNEANNTDVLLVGGGGLFLKDTNPNDISGWQWPCSIDLLHQIEKPLVVFAVGYNRFRNQDDFEPYFTENINAVVEKSVFLA